MTPGPFLGILRDVPIEQYHADHSSLSNSGLGDFKRSPAHFHALHLNRGRPPPAEKAGQLEGSLAHCAILEPHTFEKRYATGPQVSRATKIWKTFEEEHGVGGVVCIKPDQRETALRQARSVMRNDDIAALLSSGDAEVSAWWLDPVTGVQCRCRPDHVHPVLDAGVILVDVKTYSSAAPDDFMLQVAKKGYARQAAFYSDGYAIASGKSVVGFVFVCVETAWPYAAAAYMLPDQWLDLARREIAELLPRYAECVKADAWPSYSDTVQLLDMPRWIAREAYASEY